MLTRGQVKSWLRKTVALDGHDAAALEYLIEAAIDLAVDDAYPTLGETVFTDIIGDGATVRWLLTGNDIEVLQDGEQVQPQYPDTARIANPTVALTLSQNATPSSLAAGVYTFTYRYNTAFGVTPPAVTAQVTIAANTSVGIAGLVLPTTQIPITTVDILGSAGPYDPRLLVWASFTAAQIASAQVLSVLPTSTAYLPQTYLGDFTQAGFVETRNVVMVEQQTDLTGAYVDGSAVISTTGALAAGTLVRVWYLRRAVFPKEDNDVIHLDNGYVRLKALAHLHSLLAGNVSGGDFDVHTKQADYWSVQAEKRRDAAPREFIGQGFGAREIY